jgi:TPR repeat protein
MMYESQGKHAEARASYESALRSMLATTTTTGLSFTPGYIVNAAKCRLAWLVETGKGFAATPASVSAQDKRRAFILYQEAADSGSPDGLYYTAWCCETGMGTEKNEVKAVDLFSRADEAGQKAAHSRLHNMLLQGRDGTAALTKQVAELQARAEMNEATAQHKLAECYSKLAANWLRRSKASAEAAAKASAPPTSTASTTTNTNPTTSASASTN